MTFKSFVQYAYIVILLGILGSVLYTQGSVFLTSPCTTPLEYSLGSIDPKFNVSATVLKNGLAKAAGVWNTELGKELIVFKDTGGIPVNLVYSEQQGAVSLGKTIDADQKAYDVAKQGVQSMKAEYDAARKTYEVALATYNTDKGRYEEDVANWNGKGGAPPSEYQKLEQRKKQLMNDLETLNEYVRKVNKLAGDIDYAVTQLNVAAKKINAKVDTYNAAAGTDFDQGNYTDDEDGKRINVFEFQSASDLTRTLTHEFGHALGLGHVENPASVMYAYNISSDLMLSDEDIAELKAVCKIKS